MGKADTMTEIAQPLVTVIVPVYKVEPYLRRCIDSIISQTYHNLEIILVDDGSPDGCPEICDEYAKRDSRIKVIHKKNGGLSDARNVGLGSSSGKYVMFVDSDDWIDNDLIETVMSLQPFKVALYGCTVVSEQGKNIDVISSASSVRTITFRDDPCAVEQLINSSLFGYACNKIYEKASIGNIRFMETPQREDLIFNIEVMKNISEITLSESCGYYYLKRSDSILHGAYSGELPEIKNAIRNMKTVHPELDAAVNRRCANHILKTFILDFVFKYVCQNKVPSEKQKLSFIKELFSCSDIRIVIRYYFNEPRLLQFFSVCYKFNLPALFYHVIIRWWGND